MAGVNDVIEYAKLLRHAPVKIDAARCVSVRNRNSSCKKCAAACIANAIQIDKNEIQIDTDACINCGVCQAVCPTGALDMTSPCASAAANAIASVCDWQHARLIVACARAGATHTANPDKFAELPCLAHITEHIILQVSAAGIDDIILVDGNCATCKLHAADNRIDTTLDTAARLLDAAAASAIITRTQAFPKDIAKDKGALSHRGDDRRGIMAHAGAYVKDVALDVADKAVRDKLGRPKAQGQTTQASRATIGKTAHLPQIEPTGNYILIEAMEKLRQNVGEGGEGELNCRRFGSVHVDADACSGCGLCVMFCPTGALVHNVYDKPANPKYKYLDFSASMCLQCSLCADVCMRNCLKVSSRVDVQDIFDFEPQLIEIKNPDAAKSIFKRH